MFKKWGIRLAENAKWVSVRDELPTLVLFVTVGGIQVEVLKTPQLGTTH
jgi:hypothetical protein